MTKLLQDLTYAFRRIAANKAFTAVAVACLALGIGTSTTGFSVVDGVLIQPLPYQDAERLVVLNKSNLQLGIRFAGIPYQELQDWQQQTSVFTTIAGLQVRGLTLADNLDPERLLGGAVGAALFPMLGVQPVVGRGFDEEDDQPGAAPVVLLSYSLWQRRYAGSPTIVGQTVRVDGRSRMVIGVMPPRFEFPATHHVWIPLGPEVPDAQRRDHFVTAFAHVKPGVSFARVRDDLAVVARRLELQYPENRGWAPVVRPMRDYFIPEDIELVLVTIMGAVTLVLLVACANVANLLLARASTRQREIALRAALGAGRSRIVRQLLTESVILALISAPLGLAFAYGATTFILRAVPPESVPSFVRWSVDLRSFAYAMSAAFLTGVGFGVAPALQAARVDLQYVLKEGSGGAGGGATRNRLLNGIVIMEIAVSCVLLVGALLFVRTFLNLQRVTGGFDARPLMTMRIYMPERGYESADIRVQRVGDILRRVESLGNVEAAFASNLVPLAGGAFQGPVAIDGHQVPPGEEPMISYIGVTPHLVRTLNVAVRQGRPLTDAEAMSRSHAAIISETMARRFWPTSSPMGARFRLVRDNDVRDWMTVVGVVADIRQEPVPGREQLPAAYIPFPYNVLPTTGLTIRVSGDAAAVTNAARAAIRQSDPNIAVAFVRPMEELRQLGYWPYKIFGWVFSIMAIVALCLGVVGVYGVLAYSVAQRRQEIGVRVALGATKSDVLRLILLRGLRLAAGGIALGVAGALAVTQLIRSVLYNVAPTDPFTFGVIVVTLFLVALMTSYLPARQATTVDPIVALRAE